MKNHAPKGVLQKLLDLTIALYRVTDLFPKDEVLKRQIREKANDVISGIVEYEYVSDREKQSHAQRIHALILSLKGYFQLARALSFVDARNLVILEREYDTMSEFFPVHNDFYAETGIVAHASSRPLSRPHDVTENEQSDRIRTQDQKIQEPKIKKNRPERISDAAGALAERQKRMVEHTRRSLQANLNDFTKLFPHVSVKTIQRDVSTLIQKDILQKKGQRRWTVYSLK